MDSKTLNNFNESVALMCGFNSYDEFNERWVVHLLAFQLLHVGWHGGIL
jgi:hypothetical protein